MQIPSQTAETKSAMNTALGLLSGGHIREVNGELLLTKGLTKQWVETLRILFMGQSEQDLKAFDNAIERFHASGYGVTSLVIDLRCVHENGIQRWTYEIRPKIGSRPRRNGFVTRPKK